MIKSAGEDRRKRLEAKYETTQKKISQAEKELLTIEKEYFVLKQKIEGSMDQSIFLMDCPDIDTDPEKYLEVEGRQLKALVMMGIKKKQVHQQLDIIKKELERIEKKREEWAISGPELIEEIKLLVNENEKLRKEKRELSIKVDVLQNELDGLKQELEKSKKYIDENNSKPNDNFDERNQLIIQLKEKIENYREEIVNMRNNFNENKRTSNLEIKALKNAINADHKKLNESKKRVPESKKRSSEPKKNFDEIEIKGTEKENMENKEKEFKKSREDIISKFEENVSQFQLLKDISSGHQDTIFTLAVSPNGEYIVSGSWDSAIRVWRDTNYSNHFILENEDSINGDTKMKNENTLSFTFDKALNGHSNYITSIICSYLDEQNSTDMAIVSGSVDNTVKLWDIETGECKWTGIGHSNEVHGIAVSTGYPDKFILSVGDDCQICLWNAKEKNPIKIINDSYPNSIADVEFWGNWASENSINMMSQRHERFVVNGNDENFEGVVKLFDTERGEMIMEMKEKHDGEAWKVTVSENYNFSISCAFLDTEIKIHDLRSGDKVRDLIGHMEGVNELKLFGNDWIVSTSHDKTLKIWNIQDGRCLMTLEGHSGPVCGTAIDPIFGRWIVSGGSDFDVIKLWSR